MSGLKPWRVGRKVGRTVYLGDALIGIFDTPAMALEAVNSLNGDIARDATDTAALRKVRDEMAITLAELQTNAINHTDLTHLACGRLATDVYVQLAELNAILKERE